MLKQCLHPYQTQGNKACNNSFTNCKMPKLRCQYAGTPIQDFQLANFVLRYTTDLRRLLRDLQQSGVQITKDQLCRSSRCAGRTSERSGQRQSKERHNASTEPTSSRPSGCAMKHRRECARHMYQLDSEEAVQDRLTMPESKNNAATVCD